MTSGTVRRASIVKLTGPNEALLQSLANGRKDSCDFPAQVFTLLLLPIPLPSQSVVITVRIVCPSAGKRQKAPYRMLTLFTPAETPSVR